MPGMLCCFIISNQKLVGSNKSAESLTSALHVNTDVKIAGLVRESLGVLLCSTAWRAAMAAVAVNNAVQCRDVNDAVQYCSSVAVMLFLFCMVKCDVM